MTPPVPDTWIVGDLQGCSAPLDTLFDDPRIAGSPEARFWFAGDIVNRGPDSLGALRRVMALGERAIMVLGNHDLHLLAVAAGIGKVKKGDTVASVLEAPDATELIDWLRHRPVAHYEHGHLLVHAGIHPQWDVRKTMALASEVHAALRAPDWRTNLAQMYGNKPDQWDDRLAGSDRLRAIINILTRIRMCHPDGRLDFSHKGPPDEAPEGLMPWFDLPGRASGGDTVVFGHWSTLGLLMRPDVVCLDTGCIWGRHLTAMRIADRALAQVHCAQTRRPGDNG
ncbi:symmetrical bis(5'-nucleosyl)-tetraphosphatase [Pusillimonas sp. TS35]|uniref:symmetrical bis(5'-nucleosyl)-tetraphosphatase n=1 Tax=Paracandidimonas lactea TaxID=2895524 RepID=UPI00136ACFA2|nr:symmetrical bis(5'-nucleosyl)-tetraphosphatase [Paracandidimonas lactea]MYN14074.1 symmetrical bis(5'-nucleosyl)-tetraphosphatase [Pusillimonas sp. TS35]